MFYMLMIIALIAGILSTLVMTVFIQLLGYRQTKSVPWLLGTFIAVRLKPAQNVNQARLLAWGNMVHYITGIGLVALYFLLWHEGWLTHSYTTVFIYGAVTGLIAVALWLLILNAHPLKAFISLSSFLISIFISHLIFAFSMASLMDLSMIFLLDPEHFPWMYI